MLICRARLPKDRISAMDPHSSAFSFSYFRHPAGLAACRPSSKRTPPISSQLFGCGIMPRRVLLPRCLRYSVGQLQDHQEIHPMLWVLEERGIAAVLVAPRDTLWFSTHFWKITRGNMSKNKGCDNRGHDRDFGWWNAIRRRM
jgi:hypothetical protein